MAPGGGRSGAFFLASRAFALAALPAGAVDLNIGLCAPLHAAWGVRDALTFFLGLEYWRNGPPDLAGGLPRPANPTDVNVSVTTIDSKCAGQASFESSMGAFSAQGSKPDVIVGCLCSAASLNVGRFSTAFGIPMLATASQSTDLSVKSDYPYIFRFCATEVADADVHNALLAYFQVNKTTVIYVDSQRGVKQKDRLLSRPYMKSSVDATVLRLPDADMEEIGAFQVAVEKLRAVRSSPAFVIVGYFVSAYDSGEKMATIAADRAGLLNKYSVFLFAETMSAELTDDGGDAARKVPLELRRKLTGSIVATAKPIAARIQAFKDWVRTVNMSKLVSMGLGPASLVSDQWIADPDVQLPAWTSFRFDATVGLLGVVHELHSTGQTIDSESILGGVRDLRLPGIMGDLTWDSTQDREGLVYEIFQLQHADTVAILPPALVSVGELVLDGVTPASLQESRMGFQGTPPRKRLAYLEAPACPDGMSKPDAFSMPSECTPCPKGTHSSMHTGGVCVPCQAGLHGDLEGQSRCQSCPPGAFTSAPGSLTCELCPPGTAVEVAGATACEHCARGRASSSPGTSACAWCSLGRFQPDKRASACSPCGDVLQGSSTALLGAERSEQCICPSSSYKPLGRARCMPCPEGMTCGDGSAEANLPGLRGATNASCEGTLCAFPVPSVGFYVDAADPMSVYRCNAEMDCPGGAANACDRGRQGIACGRCGEGRYRDTGGRCVPCTDVEKSSILFPVLPLIFGPLLVIVMHAKSQDPVDKWGSPGNSAAVVLYTFVVYLQSLATLRRCYVDIPKMSEEGLGWSSHSFDFVSILRPDCAALHGFQAHFMFLLMGPVVLMAVFAAVYGVCKLLQRSVKSLPRLLVLDRDIVFNCYGSLFFTFYIGIVSQCVSLFQCYPHPNTLRSMRTEPDIICYSGEWMELLAAAIVAVLLLCLGPLGLVLRVLYVSSECFTDPAFRKRWKFLFIKFRTSGHAWSMVILAKGIGMNMTTVIFDSGVRQVAWLMAVFEAYLLATCAWRPWRSMLAQLNDVFQHSVLIFILGVMFVFTAASNKDDFAMATLIMAILPMVGVVVVVTVLGYMWLFGTDSLPERLHSAVASQPHAMAVFKLPPGLRSALSDGDMAQKLAAMPYADVLTLKAAHNILEGQHRSLPKFAGVPKHNIPSVCFCPDGFDVAARSPIGKEPMVLEREPKVSDAAEEEMKEDGMRSVWWVEHKMAERPHIEPSRSVQPAATRHTQT